MRHYRMQLMDVATGAAIQTAGGKVYVATADETAKVTLYTSAGAETTNPAALTNGIVEFYTSDDVATVDLYIQAPSGHFKVLKGVAASGPNSIFIDKGNANTVMVIPFSIDDTTAASETDTGFDLLVNSMVLPSSVSVDVLTIDATETIDVGILSTEANGDANGFVAAASVAAAINVKATLTNGSATLGALLSVQDSANAGDLVPEAYRCDGTAKSISYTLTAGTDTAEGFIILPVQLPVASL